MAEVAAGAGIALAAEQVISTTAQVGTAGYILSQPTQPLKATFTRIATADDNDMHRRSLTRSHHSVTIINNKAHIFGGTTSTDGEIATNDIHIVNLSSDKQNDHDPEYQVIPALAAGPSGTVPAPRTHHAACAFNSKVAIYGGSDASGSPIDEGSSIQLYDPESKTWSLLTSSSTAGSAPGPRIGARLFAASTGSNDSKSLYLYGGTTESGRVSSDLWRFDVPTLTWHALPNPPALASSTNAALANDHLYLISSPEEDGMSSSLHILPLSNNNPPTTTTADGNPSDPTPSNTSSPTWTTLTFPTNPLAPGPRARHSGALLPISTGYGRNYLVYLLGTRSNPPSNLPTTSSPSEENTPNQWSDTWTLQLPSSSPLNMPDTTNTTSSSLKQTIQPAHIKDTLRSTVGASSGTWSWAEVELGLPPALTEQPPTLGQKIGNAAEKVKIAITNNVSSIGGGKDEAEKEKDRLNEQLVKEEEEQRKGGGHVEVVEDVTEGKLHPGPRSCFGADVFSTTSLGDNNKAKVFFWGGVDARGERVGDGWVIGFE